jgi:hypothetical protein
MMTMPGKHKDPTIAFRPSPWERALIEERASLSGLHKKDFIARSCIYSNIVVTGTRENISRIVDELQVMESVLLEIAAQMECGNLSLSKEAFDEMRMDFLALIITTLDIMKGASYLFNVNGVKEEIDWKSKLHNLPDNI